jgi:O-antigen ligase
MLSKKNINIILILALLGVAFLSVFVEAKYILLIIGAFLAIAFFLYNLEFGLYLMVALYPFIYLQLWIGNEINIPYVDLVALFIFTAWIIQRFYLHFSGQRQLSSRDFFGLGVFMPFFIASLLSLINVTDFGLGLKYVLRPIVFFYLMFVVLPYNVIDSKRVLNNVFKILFWVGLGVSLMGVYSLFFADAAGVFRRAVPVAILGINILGTNHNLISEVLISVIPVVLILIWQEKSFKTRQWLILSLALMMVINLLTFSRTGWIALLLEILILTVVYFRKNLKRVAPILIAMAVLFLPIIVLMFGFLETPIVESSNANRIRLTQIALDSFKENPLLGSGAGTFIEKVTMDEWYIIDFGIPLEAHGVVQKLMAETGILGLVTFFFLLGYLLFYLIKVYKKIPPDSTWRLIMICLVLSVVGSIVFQLFNTSYFVSKMWLPIGIALAASRLALKENNVSFKN